MINMVMINAPSKDARLPVQLQRAMAAEAEAAREARAKVGFNMVYRVGNNMVKRWPGQGGIKCANRQTGFIDSEGSHQ